MSRLRTQAFRRQPMANISSAAFTISGAGVITNAAHNTLINTVPSQFVASSSETEPWRGGRVLFFGTAADNTLHDYRVYGSWQLDSPDPDNPQWLLVCLCYGQFRLSAALGTGTSRTAILASERIADEISVTKTALGTSPVGIGAAVVTTFGGVDPNAYSPLNDTPAVLLVPEMGNPQRIFVDLKAASGDVGVCIAADT